MTNTKGAQAPLFSELHIRGIPREQKGLWIAASRAKGVKLEAWAIEVLNNAATLSDNAKPCKLPKTLSTRTRECLTRAGLNSKREVRQAFERQKFNWQSIQNFGYRNYEEVLKWLEK